MAKMSIMDLQYKRARMYVRRNYPKLLGSWDGKWYAPLVEAYVAGAQGQRAYKGTYKGKRKQQAGKTSEHTK